MSENDKSRLLIISTSKLHDSDYLEYLVNEFDDFLGAVREMVFIPYARPGGMTWDEYTQLPKKALAAGDIQVKGLQEFRSPEEGLQAAQAVFVGGGNTFLLLKTLYEKNLIKPLRKRVREGLPYIGSSAGSNIAGLSIGTSNDMPLVYPPSFEALGLLPFNINPHYLDPDPDSTHQGETRERRIHEFHHFNDQPVIGLREGSWLRKEGPKLELKGQYSARFFRKGQDPEEFLPGEYSAWLKP